MQKHRAHRDAATEAILMIGERVRELGPRYVAAALEPDLRFSGLVQIEQLMLPASTGQWPERDIDEYLWVVSERIGWASHCCRGTVPEASVSAYLAMLLLQFELVVGEQAIPRAPEAAAILSNASRTIGETRISLAIADFLSAAVESRQSRPEFSSDNIHPLVACRYLIRQQICRLEYEQAMSRRPNEPVKALWLWASPPTGPDDPQVLWKEAVTCESSRMLEITGELEILHTGDPWRH